MRDTAADLFEKVLRTPWRPHHGSLVSHRTLEAAFSRRIDRVLRQLEQLYRSVEVGNEAVALFVRFWLTANPPLHDTAIAAAQAKGDERYNGLIEALARRLDSDERLIRV